MNNEELHDLIINKIGFKEHDFPKILAFCERMDMSIPCVIRMALRQLQINIEPPPEMVKTLLDCMEKNDG